MDPKALVSSLGSVDEERLLRALHRIKDELLDIDYFAPGEYVQRLLRRPVPPWGLTSAPRDCSWPRSTS
jgi:hypothetical protein